MFGSLRLSKITVESLVNVVTPQELNLVYGELNEINGEKNVLLLIFVRLCWQSKKCNHEEKLQPPHVSMVRPCCRG